MLRVAAARIGLLCLLALGLASPGAAAAPAAGRERPVSAASSRLRILYAGDWTGSMQIFAADPSGRAPVRQVTFARPTGPCYSPTACGFTRPLPSPDGRSLAYWSLGATFQTPTLWLAHADGTGARAIGAALDAAWSPDSRRLVYSAPDGIHVVTATRANGIVDRRENILIADGQSAGGLGWSPDGRTLAFVDGRGLILLRGGRERVLVQAAPVSFAWSPDGRRIAYATRKGIFLVATASGHARLVYPLPADLILSQLEVAFAPGGRLLAFGIDGLIRFLDTRTLHVTTTHAFGHDIAWSPNGRNVLYVEGGESAAGDSISTGDVKAVTPNGHVRTLISASKPYGGQIVAAAWTTLARTIRYRAPQHVDGIFAGGPVQELAADGGRVAFIACGGVSAWTPATGAVVSVARAPDCRASFSRGHVYSLGLAGDRLVWVEKGWGLCFQWDAHEATLGAPPLELGRGSGCLGSAPASGMGTAVGAGSLLVLSAWKLDYGGGRPTVTEQTIERVEPGGCPCPALSSSRGPYTPLDVDGGRIVVSGENETRILDANGAILLSLPVPTLAAQLSGTDAVLAAGGELRVYDTETGVLRAAWPLPAQPAGHDCDVYGDPSCTPVTRLTFGDVAHGLAAYAVDGKVHLLRLGDGADKIVGPGTVPRFMDSGLVYADGARIRFVPYAELG